MSQAWEPWVAAAFAPVAVWVLWRLQTYSVELLRWRLVKLVRWGGTRWLYGVVSWFGVFLHELSHASVLLLSGHGIKGFRAGVESGHVLPGRMRKGPVAFLFFLVAALAPLFVPPILMFLGLFFLVDRGMLAFATGGDGLAGAVEVLRLEFVEFPFRLARAMVELDLAHWPHLAVFAAILLAMPASRPSHVKGSRFHGTKDEGDVAVLRQKIRERPLVFVAFLALLYAAYFTTLLAAEPYWYAFQALWAVAITGIVLCLFGAVWWTLVALSAQTKAILAWAGPAAFVAVQAGMRLPQAGSWSAAQVNVASLAAWAVVGLGLAILVPRRRGIA